MMMAVYDSFQSGRAGDEPPLQDKLGFAWDTFKEEQAKQFRFSTLFTKALHPNPNNTIAAQVFAKKETINRAEKEYDSLVSNGMVVNGMPVAGNTLEPPQDPGYQTLVFSTKPIKQMLAPIDERISQIRREISETYNASRDPRNDQAYTVHSRQERIDALNLEIQSLKAKQLLILQTAEDDLSEFTSKQTGDQFYRMNLSSVKPRPNLR